ncbi:MAG: hypothetical protein ACJ78Q_05710, partial [Chloroflexia bacterium]
SSVKTPGGQSVQAESTGMFAETDMQGIYSISVPGRAAQGADTGPRMFAVNMIDRVESDNRPRAHPELDRQGPAVVERQIKQEQWSQLAAIVLGLLGAEWLYYCWKRGSV